MPNWCSNNLVVQANESKYLLDFLEKIKGKDEGGNVVDFTFSSLVPQPQEEGDWYKWNIENWGTKWNVGDFILNVEDDDTVAYFNFDTAWSPPVEWLQKVAPMFPNLSFELLYHEGGMGFAGRLVIDEDGIGDASYNSGEEGYWEIVTHGMSDADIEDRAMETIKQNALDYWEYSLNDLVRYIGEEKREKIENMLLVKKLSDDLIHANSSEFMGADIDDIVEETIGREQFYVRVFNDKKKNSDLRKIAV
jgi:hypothetical protein